MLEQQNRKKMPCPIGTDNTENTKNTETAEIDSKIVEQLSKLKEKYDVMGQDLSSYLDGLLYANYLTYWDYIHLDTLLSLQNPKTDFPDEEIFIVYHQITELYFKLIRSEMGQISHDKDLTEEWFLKRMQRINRYFRHLVDSFGIMVEGMDPEQFLKFRMSLLPASGFQSAQYRMIEIASAPIKNLVAKEHRDNLNANTTIEEMLQHAYWKNGATELSTGKKTLTLNMFEKKYMSEFVKTAYEFKDANLWQIYQSKYIDAQNISALTSAMREFDHLVNVEWPLQHYKSAVRYLQKDPEVISATGGTNWQKYLPPRFQLRIFYPELWSAGEKENWGKEKVEY
ncbi:MAG: tryptophan 2,3-dioxygenase [Bacteroidia bacterium]